MKQILLLTLFLVFFQTLIFAKSSNSPKQKPISEYSDIQLKREWLFPESTLSRLAAQEYKKRHPDEQIPAVREMDTKSQAEYDAGCEELRSLSDTKLQQDIALNINYLKRGYTKPYNPSVIKNSLDLQRLEMIRRNPTWSETICHQILNCKIALGMTGKQLATSLGSPNDINRTVNRYGTREQWVYSNIQKDPVYVYLDNNVVTSYQD